MEQNNNQNESFDLSHILNENEAESESSIKERRSEKEILEREKIPGIYRLILIKCQGDGENGEAG